MQWSCTPYCRCHSVSVLQPPRCHKSNEAQGITEGTILPVPVCSVQSLYGFYPVGLQLRACPPGANGISFLRKLISNLTMLYLGQISFMKTCGLDAAGPCRLCVHICSCQVRGLSNPCYFCKSIPIFVRISSSLQIFLDQVMSCLRLLSQHEIQGSWQLQFDTMQLTLSARLISSIFQTRWILTTSQVQIKNDRAQEDGTVSHVHLSYSIGQVLA